MGLYPANSCPAVAREDLDLVADGERPIHKRSGDDGAEASQGERSVDGKTRAPDVAPHRRRLEH